MSEVLLRVARDADVNVDIDDQWIGDPIRIDFVSEEETPITVLITKSQAKRLLKGLDRKVGGQRGS